MPAQTSAEVVLIQQLHDEHLPDLRSYCLRLTGNDRAQAEDVVQETLLRAWVHASTLDGRRGSVRGWLRRVARNVVIDEWRTPRARRELTVDDVPEPEQDGGDPEGMLLSWVVTDALAQLSQPHREVLLECYYRGASVAEASRRLGIPPGTVKSRTHYALRALKLALEEVGLAR